MFKSKIVIATIYDASMVSRATWNEHAVPVPGARYRPPLHQLSLPFSLFFFNSSL